MTLDLATLLTVLLVLFGLMTAVLGAIWLGDRSNAAAGTLALGFLSSGAGSALAALYQHLPQWAWALVASALLLAGQALILAGLRRFDGKSTPRAAILAAPAAFLAICLVTGIWVHQGDRAALFCALFSILTFACAHELRAGWRAEPLFTRRPLSVMFGVLGLLYAVRSVVAFAGLGNYAWLGAVFLLQIFAVFAFAIGLFALIKERAELALRHAAHTDELTGIANRRSFFERARGLLRGTMLVLDLDHFKRINDRFGHAVGDDVLERFAAMVTGHLNGNEMFARLGGEEFGLFLPEVDEGAAVELAERLRCAAGDLCVVAESESVPVRVSIGIAGSGREAASLEDLLGRADAALYRAKQLGRNRLHSASFEVDVLPAAPAQAA